MQDTLISLIFEINSPPPKKKKNMKKQTLAEVAMEKKFWNKKKYLKKLFF